MEGSGQLLVVLRTRVGKCEPQRSTTLVMNVSVNSHVNTADEKFVFMTLLKPKALFISHNR